MDTVSVVFINVQNCNMRAPAEFGCEAGEVLPSLLSCLALWVVARQTKCLEWKRFVMIRSLYNKAATGVT